MEHTQIVERLGKSTVWGDGPNCLHIVRPVIHHVKWVGRTWVRTLLPLLLGEANVFITPTVGVAKCPSFSAQRLNPLRCSRESRSASANNPIPGSRFPAWRRSWRDQGVPVSRTWGQEANPAPEGSAHSTAGTKEDENPQECHLRTRKAHSPSGPVFIITRRIQKK